jgi:hypothetical protein
MPCRFIQFSWVTVYATNISVINMLSNTYNYKVGMVYNLIDHSIHVIIFKRNKKGDKILSEYMYIF